MAVSIAKIAGAAGMVTAVIAAAAAAVAASAPVATPAEAEAAQPQPAPASAPAPIATAAEPEAASADPAAPRRLTGVAGTDLNAAMAAAGVPDRIAQDYLRALSGKIRLADGVSVADRFDLVVVGEPGSERLLYAGLDRMGALDVQLMRWAADGKAAAGWVDATGTAAQAEAMRMPVSGGVSSSFGMRSHPVYHSQRFHRGVDLRAAAGTPIRAPAAGRVLSAGWSGGYGRQVRLSHGEGLATTFSHMSRIAAAPGSLVQAGEVIGYVGSTGLSTGPHLHYEVYKNGKAVNPMAARMIGESAMGREERHAFNARLRALLTSGQGG